MLSLVLVVPLVGDVGVEQHLGHPPQVLGEDVRRVSVRAVAFARILKRGPPQVRRQGFPIEMVADLLLARLGVLVAGSVTVRPAGEADVLEGQLEPPSGVDVVNHARLPTRLDDEYHPRINRGVDADSGYPVFDRNVRYARQCHLEASPADIRLWMVQNVGHKAAQSQCVSCTPSGRRGCRRGRGPTMRRPWWGQWRRRFWSPLRRRQWRWRRRRCGLVHPRWQGCLATERSGTFFDDLQLLGVRVAGLGAELYRPTRALSSGSDRRAQLLSDLIIGPVHAVIIGPVHAVRVEFVVIRILPTAMIAADKILPAQRLVMDVCGDAVGCQVPCRDVLLAVAQRRVATSTRGKHLVESHPNMPSAGVGVGISSRGIEEAHGKETEPNELPAVHGEYPLPDDLASAGHFADRHRVMCPDQSVRTLRVVMSEQSADVVAQDGAAREAFRPLLVLHRLELVPAPGRFSVVELGRALHNGRIQAVVGVQAVEALAFSFSFSIPARHGSHGDGRLETVQTARCVDELHQRDGATLARQKRVDDSPRGRVG